MKIDRCAEPSALSIVRAFPTMATLMARYRDPSLSEQQKKSPSPTGRADDDVWTQQQTGRRVGPAVSHRVYAVFRPRDEDDPGMRLSASREKSEEMNESGWEGGRVALAGTSTNATRRQSTRARVVVGTSPVVNARACRRDADAARSIPIDGARFDSVAGSIPTRAIGFSSLRLARKSFLHADMASSRVTGSLATWMVHPGRGPYLAQYPAPSFAPFASSHAGSTGTPVGCALQYGLATGLARYC